MAWLSALLLLCAVICDVHANGYPFPQDPKALHEVFQVDMRAPDRYPSSCARPLWQSRDGRPNAFGGQPLYDPQEDFYGRDANMLNHMWFQAYAMLSTARAAIWPRNYAMPQVYSLVYSFFGLWPNPDADDKEPEEGDKVFLDVLRARYAGVQQTIERAQADGRNKPKLFCGGAYWEIQYPESPARQRDGSIIKRPDGTDMPLLEWELQHNRDYHKSWYLWYDIDYPSGSEKGYIVLDKEEHPADPASAPFPWPLAANGQPDFCLQEIYAQVLHATTPRGQGTDAWQAADHIILCPLSFTARVDMNDIDFAAPQTEGSNGQDGTHIDLMSVPGITLLHELHHVAYRDFSNDVYPWFPRRDPDDQITGKISEDFPNQKSGFSQARVHHCAEGPTQSMSIASYELAEPISEGNDIQSVFAPESAAWFARAIDLTMRTHQDWSTGYCLPWNTQPLQGPSAPIVESCLDEVSRAKHFFNESLLSNISYAKAGHGVQHPWEVPLCDIFREVMAQA
ncbi:hypothetical protein CB0940_01491 [Cercospora beticola]|uniref:Uncharacterized protein n=1 Tax=Cercospora beticola TaxID=122368 RepID=A0A2G5I7N9_CERBT|nr:hypothetical protein CB0940_01491 [Cercospora beticola]PIB00856.1 hypothetical protein CB0940_01491 [Cercospora beticola]WPA96931.1 hypothetical protein RHO25_001539 [Cercospora beticola]